MTNKTEWEGQTPLFSCSDPICRTEYSLPADMLAVFEGQPLCQSCYEENPPFDPVDWSALPRFVPAQEARITALEAERDALREALAKVAPILEGIVNDGAADIQDGHLDGFTDEMRDCSSALQALAISEKSE